MLWLDEWRMIVQVYGGTSISERNILASILCLNILVLKKALLETLV